MFTRTHTYSHIPSGVFEDGQCHGRYHNGTRPVTRGSHEIGRQNALLPVRADQTTPPRRGLVLQLHAVQRVAPEVRPPLGQHGRARHFEQAVPAQVGRLPHRVHVTHSRAALGKCGDGVERAMSPLRHPPAHEVRVFVVRRPRRPVRVPKQVVQA